MIRFVGNNPDGLPQKRSQSLRACENCRKRKKRCQHSAAIEIGGPNSSVTPTIDTLTPRSIPQPLPTPNTVNESYSSTHETSISGLDVMPLSSEEHGGDGDSDGENGDSFVGDLNPASIFLAATTPQTTLSSDDDNVGIWIPRKALEGLRKQAKTNLVPQSPSHIALLSNILLPYVQQQCQHLLPPPQDYAELHRIYVQEIHPILPVINLEMLQVSENMSSTLVIKQAICVAASTSPRARDSLRLPDSNGQVVASQPGAFASILVSAIRSSIDLGFLKDRTATVQALTVLALFSQFSHQSNQSAEFTARAISHAQTMGLHLEAPATTQHHVYLTRLFCCVWAIDKLNSAFQGRPTMLHDHDFNRDMIKTMNSQEGCFRLLLRVVSYLDVIIAMYRPMNSNSVPFIPAFEDLIHESDAVRVPSGLLATIELLYHAVIMLSCRSKSSTHAASPLEVRETLSAANVVSIIGTEFRDQISHVPFAPYGLSLALRVFYRELRFKSKLPFTQNRVRKQLLNACKLLRESFTDSFPSAMKVADLAEQTVREMDKVYNNILQQYGNSRSTSETVGQMKQNGSSEGIVSDIGRDSQPSAEPSVISFDPDALESFPDLNVFEFFDSDFHLDVIDAALIDNMAL